MGKNHRRMYKIGKLFIPKVEALYDLILQNTLGATDLIL